tara:strand:- start:713 stop:1258 length:546 start_codon:yes stop_codon:yes gene_type:complete
MDGFTVIRLRITTIKRFKLFSKKVARSYSDSLEAMIDFFEWHNYSPNQRFAEDISAGQKKNRERIEASIAISKSIEKAQNIPLTNIETMLRSLFQEEYKNQDMKLLEAEVTTSEITETNKEKTTVSKIKYDRSLRKLEKYKERLNYLLGKVEPVSNRFGKDFLKLDITREELARFKQIVKD